MADLIRISSLTLAVIEGVIMAASGGLIFKSWYFDARSRIYRKLARLPRTPVGEVTENQLVRVVGLVKNLEHSVVAPVSGTHCVYWNVSVELKDTGKWVEVVNESNGTPFVLADDPAYVIVDPRNADITTKHLRYLPHLGPNLFLDRFLAKHDLLRRKPSVRIREMRIEIGETFTIMGVGVGDRDPLAAQPDGYRTERTTCFRFEGSKRYPLVVSDDPSLR